MTFSASWRVVTLEGGSPESWKLETMASMRPSSTAYLYVAVLRPWCMSSMSRTAKSMVSSCSRIAIDVLKPEGIWEPGASGRNRRHDMKMPAKTEAVFDYLRLCARQMRTVTYKEVAEATVLAKPGVGRPLGYIRDQICIARGLPWLNARSEERRVGKGC